MSVAIILPAVQHIHGRHAAIFVGLEDTHELRELR